MLLALVGAMVVANSTVTVVMGQEYLPKGSSPTASRWTR
jgi:hypothetical protein